MQQQYISTQVISGVLEKLFLYVESKLEITTS